MQINNIADLKKVMEAAFPSLERIGQEVNLLVEVIKNLGG